MPEKNDSQNLVPLKPPGRWYVWLLVTFILSGVMFYYFYSFPHRNIGPEQPIPFSHRVHAGVKNIECRFCHPYVETGPRAGIPPMEKCFYCHDYVIPLHPEIVRERQHYEEEDPVRWARVYYVPDHVQFTHEPHIRWAKLECARCHGEAQKMDRLKYVSFQMGFCINCHRKMNAQQDCWLACHH